MPSWGNACETIPFPYRHFERKREIFFRSRSSRRCEDSGISVSQPSPQGEGAPKGRIGQKRYERERGRPSQVRRLRQYPIHRWRGPPSPRGKAKRRRLRRKKKANPASLRSAAPSRGRGSRGHTLLPLEGGAPKGRRLDGESGMKKSGEDRLKCAVYESTLSTAGAVPLPRWGRQRGGGSAAKKKANPASLRSAAPSKGRGSRGHSLLPMEGGAPKGRIGQKRYEKEREKTVSSTPFTKAPYPPLARSPFPDGEGKEEAASPQKKKPTPPRCARQPLPREGARVDTPSFLWKEGE